MLKKFILIIIFSTISIFNINAETIEIEMLNKMGKERHVYSVKVAKINVDDKIVWKSVDRGHNVEFIGMPKGIKKFKSKVSKDTEYTFKIPGIYLYQCTPHKALGMIGLVIVNNDKSNLEDIMKIKLRGKSKKVFSKLIKTVQ